MKIPTLFGMLISAAGLLLGQSSTAEIRGLVSDVSGAVVPGARVEVIHAGTGESRTFRTDASAQYIAPQLIPGPYEIRVDAQGFRKLVRQGIVLQA